MTSVNPGYSVSGSSAPTLAQTADVVDTWPEYGAECLDNQGKVEVDVNGNNIIVTVNGGVDSLNEWPSSNPAQGTGKWIALNIDTGTDDITKVKYQGALLEQADVEEANLWGFGPGHFVLWIKADAVKNTPKTFTLGGEAGETKEFTITVVDGE